VTAAPPRGHVSQRLLVDVGEACGCIQELIDYQQEFEGMKDNQPENLQDGPMAQKCDEICGTDLEGALNTVQEAESADVPLGFGRD
jgi:hypothetical protein